MTNCDTVSERMACIYPPEIFGRFPRLSGEMQKHISALIRALEVVSKPRLRRASLRSGSMACPPSRAAQARRAGHWALDGVLKPLLAARFRNIILSDSIQYWCWSNKKAGSDGHTPARMLDVVSKHTAKRYPPSGTVTVRYQIKSQVTVPRQPG
jgi:hypothetical protein